MTHARREPKRVRSESPSQWDRRRQIVRRVFHAWSESTFGLQQFYLRRGGIVRVELVGRGAYLGYGTRPVSSRRNLLGGQKSSMSSRSGTSYRRIKCAHQRGPVSRGPLRRGRTRSHVGGRSLYWSGRGGAVGTTGSPGGGSVDTSAGATVG